MAALTAIVGDNSGATRFKAVQLFSRRKNIGGVDIDVPHRPMEQRADDRLRDTGCRILRTRPAPAADIACRAPTPRQEGNAAPSHPGPEMMEVNGNIDIEADLLR